MGVLAIKHDQDPKEFIKDKIKPFIDGLEVMGEDVLLGVYDRGAYKGDVKTTGGIILTAKNLDEDKYQGLACLILKMGPLAFVEDETHKYGSRKPQVGDWVAVRKSEGFSFVVGSQDNSQHCRLMNERGVRLIISDPDSVW